MGGTVRVLPLGGDWETLGVDRYRGIVAQDIEAVSDHWGPASLRFTLKAAPGAQRPDLTPYTPIEYEQGGLVWSGFVWERPSAKNAFTVGCRGWQYHLDDDVFERMYVHTRLQDYVDVRSILTADLTKWNAAAVIQSTDGVISIGQPIGTTWANDKTQGVTLDLGPGSTAKRIVVEWDSQGLNGNSTFQFFARTHSTPGGAYPLDAGANDAFSISFGSSPGASGTSAGTFATAGRYVTLFLYWTGAGGTTGSDHLFRVKSVKVFRDTAYESGNASILKADTVVKDARALAPLLNQTNEHITAGSFSIPEYVTGGYQSPRAVIEAVNAYENYRRKLGA